MRVKKGVPVVRVPIGSKGFLKHFSGANFCASSCGLCYSAAAMHK